MPFVLPRALERAVKSQEEIFTFCWRSVKPQVSLCWAGGVLNLGLPDNSLSYQSVWLWAVLVTSQATWDPPGPKCSRKISYLKVEGIKSAATEAISTTSCLFINCIRCVLPLFWKWRPPGNPYAKWHCQFMAFQPWTRVHSHQAPSTLGSYQYPGMCFKLVPEGGLGLSRAPHAQLGWTFFSCFLLKLYIIRRVWKSH